MSPIPPVDRQTPMKTISFHNFVCGGEYLNYKCPEDITKEWSNLVFITSFAGGICLVNISEWPPLPHRIVVILVIRVLSDWSVNWPCFNRYNYPWKFTMLWVDHEVQSSPFITLQEHQRILTNVTVSKVSDIAFIMVVYKNLLVLFWSVWKKIGNVCQ